ncbi:IS66 family insertion sequence element accessory protein TnpB, partial [Burkholderia cepacia]|uniref:IS66 family insertion sequence element accessory protein TnpB n=1 Tax=Burkholderia cepacia TaxID=292 RepID=UPI003C7EAFBE
MLLVHAHLSTLIEHGHVASVNQPRRAMASFKERLLTDMRSGFNSLAAKVQTVLERDPFSGHVFVFRGKRGDLVKVL